MYRYMQTSFPCQVLDDNDEIGRILLFTYIYSQCCYFNNLDNMFMSIITLISLCFPSPKKYAKRKKKQRTCRVGSVNMSAVCFAAGELLEFGAWPKSPLAPRLARSFMALDRKPPVTWWKDMAHRAVLKGKEKGGLWG